jgi:hypothetical protein
MIHSAVWISLGCKDSFIPSHYLGVTLSGLLILLSQCSRFHSINQI